MKRSTGGIPGGPQVYEPLGDVERSWVERKRDAASADQRREDSHVEAVRIANRTDAQATVRGRQTEPGPNPHRRREHVAMGGGDQFRAGGGG